eukprot:193617-Pelagomonas_calceolata.AAC.1
MQARCGHTWGTEFVKEGVKRSTRNWAALRERGHVPLHRFLSAWGAVEGVDPQTTNNKLATYQTFFALPFERNVRKPIRLP